MQFKANTAGQFTPNNIHLDTGALISTLQTLRNALVRSISATYAPIARSLAQCEGYSVCSVFAHGLGSATAWRATQEG